MRQLTLILLQQAVLRVAHPDTHHSDTQCVTPAADGIVRKKETRYHIYQRSKQASKQAGQFQLTAAEAVQSAFSRRAQQEGGRYKADDTQ